MDFSTDIGLLGPWSVGACQSSLKTEAKSKNFGCIVGQARALATNQRDMSRKRPSMKSVDHVGESRGGLCQVGRINLRDIAQTHHFRAGAGARDQRFHLLGGQILGFIDDDEAV